MATNEELTQMCENAADHATDLEMIFGPDAADRGAWSDILRTARDYNLTGVLDAFRDSGDKETAIYDVYEAVQDAWKESNILSIDSKITITVLTGTGGPANGIDFECDIEDGRCVLIRARTWWQDWFVEKAYAPLEDRTAQNMFEALSLEWIS